MAKNLSLQADDVEKMCLIGKALSAPVRLRILQLLYFECLNVGEISEKLNIPASSAGIHIKALEAAGLINTEIQPGSHGTMKLCSRKVDFLSINFTGNALPVNNRQVLHMPVGAYSDCSIVPTCGITSEENYIGSEDNPASFYLPEHIKAQLLWTTGGYVEYRFPNTLKKEHPAKSMTLSFECCSEAPNYREDWKSDISVWVNGLKCGTWTCPGDFGSRRGKLNPGWWVDGNTQYGILMSYSIRETGTWVNGQMVSDVCMSDINCSDKPFFTVRIGIADDAEYKGGFNLFGAKFGDYAQDIDLVIEY